jgi:hypothetical protein
MWSLRSDAAIISFELPWDSLLAGVAPESLVVHDQLALANYFRYQGHEIWVYLDPANGLNRAGESDALVSAGRSIQEAEIQQMFRRYAVVIDSLVQPTHLGLALETNLIRGAAPAPLYAAIRQVVNDAAADVRARNAAVKLSVSVQVDYAWGRFGGPAQGIDQDYVDFPFLQEIGLSSYPYLAGFDVPEDIPADYYSGLLAGRNTPAAVTEGGWASDLHVLERIVRMRRRVIGADRHGVDAEGLELRRVAHEAVDHRFDVGAVIADEDDERAVRAFQRVQTVGVAVDTGKREAWRFPAEIADGGMLSHKGSPLRKSVMAAH